MTRARIAGVFCLLNIVTGASALFVRGTLGAVALLVATACYVAVTVLFHHLLEPVKHGISLTAMCVGLVGRFGRGARRSSPAPGAGEPAGVLGGGVNDLIVVNGNLTLAGTLTSRRGRNRVRTRCR